MSETKTRSGYVLKNDGKATQEAIKASQRQINQVSRTGRVTLTGRNDVEVARTVELDGQVIGQVRPTTVEVSQTLWEAIDSDGRSHGDRYLNDWYAAQALKNAPKRE